MPDQVEQTFSSLQELSELQRFDPATQEIQEKREYSSNELAGIYAEASRELQRQGFDMAWENSFWIGFKKGDTEFIGGAWNDLERANLNTTGEGSDFRSGLKNTYKICVDVEPERLSHFVQMLGEQFSTVPIYGKMAKAELLSKNDFPNIILYLRGAHKNEVMDFAMALGHAVRRQLGTAQTNLDKALEVVPKSGVYITQGNYQAKIEEAELGTPKPYSLYSPDGSVFATEYIDTITYLARRRNQFLIEENLSLFSGQPISEKLINLQLAGFDGIDFGINLGIRKGDTIASIGDYIAPAQEKITELLEDLDRRYNELIALLGSGMSREQALRTASFVYLSAVLTHPLEDGNGQCCSNLITSLMFDLGFKEIYTHPLLDGKELTTKRFDSIGAGIVSTSISHEDLLDLNGVVKRMDLQRQQYAFDFIHGCLNSSVWQIARNYTVNGDSDTAKRMIDELEPPQKEYGNEFLPRLIEIEAFLSENLTEQPFASKNLTFAEQAQSHKEALLY